MIKLEKDGTTSGRVLVGDNYNGLCCEGFDCTVFAFDIVSDGDVWLHCDNEELHDGKHEAGNYYAGVLSKQMDDIVQHLADAEVPTHEDFTLDDFLEILEGEDVFFNPLNAVSDD